MKPLTSIQYLILLFKSHNIKALCFGAVLMICSCGLLRAQCNNTTVINIDGPLTATWTAPPGGPFAVMISALGGSGGSLTDIFQHSGGEGASMSGVFIVNSGEMIRAIAGDFGKNATLEGAGAGGGSGAVNCGTGGVGGCANGTILIIAAGGNGGDEFLGLGGSSLTDGDGEGGNIGGNAEHPTDWGGGGGGLNSDGQGFPPPSSNGGDGGKKVSLTGLAAGGHGSGNQVPNDGGAGMGGGGGGGDYGAGGGGGHTGGDGGNNPAARAKSFNSGEDQVNSDGADGINFTGNPVPAAAAGNVTVVCLGALPVELTQFKAVIKNYAVRLLWSTASEKDNLGYDIERSADGRNWSTLGFVPGNGTTTRHTDYTFEDHNPPDGVNYYRLKQLDTDGKFEYSPMVVADLGAGSTQFDIFPNPSASGTVSIRAVSTTEGESIFEIYDWAGYKVYKAPVYLFEGTVVYPVNLSTFPNGTYTARLEMPGGEIQFKKIVLQN